MIEIGTETHKTVRNLVLLPGWYHYPVHDPTRWDSAFSMLSHALYLQKAIEAFLDDDDNNLGKFKLSRKEWQQAHLVATILLPFQKVSVKLQSTKRPSIDSIFWTYESLFNKIDSIKATFNCP